MEFINLFERRKNMARRSGGRGPGGGGGGPKLELFLDGSRSATNITVHLFEGKNPKVGEIVKFKVGSENNPYQARVTKNDGSDEDRVVKIDAEGYGYDTIDFSTYTQSYLAAIGGGKSDVKPLPVDVTPIPAATSLKSKRFDVIVGRLTADRKNPVTFYCKDKSGNAQQGHILVSLGQGFELDGIMYQGQARVSIDETGIKTSMIRLLVSDDTATFLREETNEKIEKSLLREV
jgi:hypothetical protein